MSAAAAPKASSTADAGADMVAAARLMATRAGCVGVAGVDDELIGSAVVLRAPRRALR